MDELKLIQSLTHELEKRANNKEWLKVQHIDKQIASLLLDLKVRTLTPSVQCELDKLHRVHKSVYQYCQQESDALEEKMSLALKNREGASAYATFVTNEGGR